MPKYLLSVEAELEILPCPFCGATDIREERSNNTNSPYYYSYWMRCQKCKAEGPPNSKSLQVGDAIRLWNRRAKGGRENTEDRV